MEPDKAELERLRARVAELEQALRQREEPFQRLPSHLPDVVAEFDRNRRHLYINPAAGPMTGIPAEHYIGKTLEELDLPAKNVTDWNSALDTVFERGQPDTIEFSYPTPEGQRHFHSLLVPVLADNGSVETVFAVTRDVTDLKEAEFFIQESENKYRILFDSLADICLLVDRDSWQILDVNAAACQILGYSREELLTLKVTDISAEPEQTNAARAAKQFYIPLRYYRKKDGTVFPVELRNGAFSLREKHYLLGAARDISERVEWQKRLRAERDLLDQIMTTSPVSITVVNRDGLITFANPQAERLLNLSKDEINQVAYNAPRWQITDYEGGPVPDSELPFSRIRDTQQPLSGARHAIHGQDGWRVLLLINGAPLFDAEHQFEGAVFSMMDVTAQVWAEQALIASEQQYRQLFEELPSGFALHEIICDQANNPIDYVFLQANPAFEKITGLAVKAILGRRAREVLPQLEPYWIERFGQVALTGEPMQFDNYNADTGKHYAVHAFRPEPGQFAVIFSDVSDRKQDEATLARYTQRLQVLHEIDQAILSAQSVDEIASASLRHLRQLIPTMRASVTILDFETRQSVILSVHGNGEGSQRGLHTEQVAFPDPDWIDQLLPGKPLTMPDVLDLPSLPPNLKKVAAEGVRAYVSVPLLANGKLVGLLNLASHQPHAFETEHVEVAQEVASQIAIAIQQVRLLAQVQQHAVVMEQRVAERTIALQTANQRLRAFARARDEFVSNVSHELRNPITSLKMREHLLRRHPEHLAQHLEVIQRDTSRLERLIEDLLFLSRLDRGVQVSNQESIDLNQLTAHYLSDRQLLAEARDLTLRLNQYPQLPRIQADFGLVEQALSILLTNAMNFTPRGGQVTVSVVYQQDDEPAMAGFSVADTGPGISPEDLPYLFDRFFRGEAGRQSGTAGTGLGLAIAREIVDLHHGSIDVESEPGQGATFTIWLPLTAEPEG